MLVIMRLEGDNKPCYDSVSFMSVFTPLPFLHELG